MRNTETNAEESSVTDLHLYLWVTLADCIRILIVRSHRRRVTGLAMSFSYPTPAPPPSHPSSASASSSSDRIILRVGGVRKNPDGSSTSRPNSGVTHQPIQPTQPNTQHSYQRPMSGQTNYPQYQPYGHGPPRNDSTASLPAANEIYTITRGGGGSSVPPSSLAHSSSAAVTGYGTHASSRPTSSHSSMSRVGSTASLPLAVALASDMHLPSSLTPTHANGLTPINTVPASSSSSSGVVSTSVVGSSSSTSSSSDQLTVPSLISPTHKIDVPLIRWSQMAPSESGGSTSEKTRELKSQFHANVKEFLKTAKQNIEEMTMELFYESEDEDGDEDEDENGDGTSTSRSRAPAITPSLVTSASLRSANSKQLGSPRKSALLQQLLQLSNSMDTGLQQIQTIREMELKKSKQGTISTHTAPKFNKNDIAQLANLIQTTTTTTTPSSSSSTSSSNNPPSSSPSKAYPSSISDSSRAALVAFVRRSQLGERHKAYDSWVAGKEAAQSKALAKAAKEAKLARLRELEAEAAQQERTKLEQEAAAAESATLACELEFQRLTEEREEMERFEYERNERLRLEEERVAREFERRQAREAELARAKLESDMRHREEEDRLWLEEKSRRESSENESRRLAEELKLQVVKELAMITKNHDTTQQQQQEEEEETRQHAELDALFREAQNGAATTTTTTTNHNDVDDHEPSEPTHSNTFDSADDPDTDEEFGEFGSPRAAAAVKASKAAAAASSTRPPPPAIPTHPGGALAGRKGRTVARTVAHQMPAFPTPPALPTSVATARPAPTFKPMSFGGGAPSQPNTSSTNYRFERAKRMHGR